MSFLMINSPLHRDSTNQYDEVLPPIGLGYICTDLQNKGFSVELFDAVAGKIPLDEIIDYIEHGNFSHVGLNIFSTNCRLVQEIVTRVSREVSFVIGGVFTKSNAQDIINWQTNNEINVVIGEGDTIVSDILLGKVQESPTSENGNKKIFKVGKNSAYFPKEISSLELDRSLFKYEPTINAQNGKKEGNIVISRGCVYDCAFCSAAVSLNKENKARIRTPESVKKEILQIKELHPEIQSIRILDDLFLRNSKSVLEAIDIFSGLELTWRAMAHIQSFKNIEDELLFKMRKGGCNELSIGIESGNNDILKSINKANTPKQIIETVKRIFKVGIGVKGYFILGFPGETKEQIEDTYNLAKSLKELSIKYGVDFRVSAFQFRPYHGTQLYYELIEQGHDIKDIEPNGDFGTKTIGEYDFGNGNFSAIEESLLNEYILKIRQINDSIKFVEYNGILTNFPEYGTFFVGLSHKLGKDWQVLEAFCESTNSGKIINGIINSCSGIPIYKTNLVRGVPINTKGKIRYPDNDEKEKGLDYLMTEINNFKPKLVYLFGKQVYDFIIKKLELKKINDFEFSYGDTTFILADHPSYIAVYKRKQTDVYVSKITDRIKKER